MYSCIYFGKHHYRRTVKSFADVWLKFCCYLERKKHVTSYWRLEELLNIHTCIAWNLNSLAHQFLK